ncbi:MAG: FtsX-like permease family protein [Tissierellia bacterium]|nr:FtsX-like permease family protein [Tissierellia bacterium]
MSWIHFERGYDKHNPDADRIYKVFQINDDNESGVQYMLPTPLKWLLEGFPEIEAVTAISLSKGAYWKDEKVLIHDGNIMLADTSFFKVFYPDIKIDYPADISDGPVILSERGAKFLGVERDNIGQYLDSLGFNILDIVSGLPSTQTNVPFDIMTIKPLFEDSDCPWCYFSNTIYVRLHENVNVELLSDKLDSIDIEDSMQGAVSFILVPLRETHYTYPENKANIKYTHLQIFITVSFLVILCALVNYLMLFVNNLRIRGRELSLRKVNGASNGNLVQLFITEIGLILLLSLFISAVLIELLYSPFLKLSEIDAPKSFFIKEMTLYGFLILLFSILISLIPIYSLKYKNISKRVNHNFTQISLFTQLSVSILLCFCTSIFLYQYKTLNNSDIGFNRFNINTFQSNVWLTKDEVAKISGVKDAVFFNGQFLPTTSRSFLQYRTESEKIIKTELVKFHEPDFVDFFEFQIIEGRNLQYGEKSACLINKTAAKEFELKSPLGEKINNFTIVGVMRDIHISPPSMPIIPSVYALRDNMETLSTIKNPITGNYDINTGPVPSSEAESISTSFNYFAYKYTDSFRESTEKEITDLVTDQGGRIIRLFNMEEFYSEYTQSERYLLILLTAMTAVAILIAIFGIYSMVTLACNRRRKEIAIRKVNGATVKEIFMLFFKQYFWITFAASALAFPIGVYVMQRWLEQYTRRVSMEWWLFAGVFALVLLIVMASMIFRVVKAAKENPAEVVKSE